MALSPVKLWMSQSMIERFTFGFFPAAVARGVLSVVVVMCVLLDRLRHPEAGPRRIRSRREA